MGSPTNGQKGEPMEYFEMNLQRFAEDGAAAPAAEGAGTAQMAETTAGGLQAGDTLADGSQIRSPRVAAAMEKQMRKHPELREVYGRGQAQTQQPQQGQQNADAKNDAQARWEALKKGEFAEQYGQDVQNAIRERFKNQKDLQGTLDKLAPALKVLRERAGVESDEELVNMIMDDDSIYEEEASEAGMTVEAYRNFLKFKEEHDQRVAQEEELQRAEFINQHYQKLAEQAQALKQQFPQFDLDKELQNETFMRLTSPAVGTSVEDAYFAVHHKELAPQMMAYGMQRARGQMAQTIMANGSRPREGGLGSQGNAAADLKLDPRGMTPRERAKLRDRIHRGERITLD